MKKYLSVLAVIALSFGCRFNNPDHPDVGLSVMSFNIGDCDYQFPTAAQVAAVVKDPGTPDILLLQEVRSEKQLTQIQQELGYPYRASILYQRQYRTSLAILSRFAIAQSDHLYFQSSPLGSGVLCGVVQPGDNPILVCSVHLDQIPSKSRLKNGYVDQSVEHSMRQLKTEILDDTVRSRSADELIKWVHAKGYETVIIGGDFNTIPFSKPIRAMNAAFDDALWPSWDYFSGTYFKIKSPLLPRVDYIFHSADLCVSNPGVIRKSPGDHYPVRATFRIGVDTHAKN
jgi:endonuclease/exonuclease/phosphatase family metal-dependent hydrolase